VVIDHFHARPVRTLWSICATCCLRRKNTARATQFGGIKVADHPHNRPPYPRAEVARWRVGRFCITKRAISRCARSRGAPISGADILRVLPPHRARRSTTAISVRQTACNWARQCRKRARNIPRAHCGIPNAGPILGSTAASRPISVPHCWERVKHCKVASASPSAQSCISRIRHSTSSLWARKSCLRRGPSQNVSSTGFDPFFLMSKATRTAMFARRLLRVAATGEWRKNRQARRPATGS